MSPFDWPRLSLSPDHGSDGVAAVSHWLGPLRINVDCTWDFAEHGCHNDVLNAIDAILGCFHVAMQLIRYNVPLSPWDEGLRFSQVKTCSLELQHNSSPNMCPLWRDFSDDMLAEEAGQPYQHQSDLEGAMWHGLKDESCVHNKGSKVIKGRYLDLVRQTKVHNREAYQRCFSYTNACLEPGFFGAA